MNNQEIALSISGHLSSVLEIVRIIHENDEFRNKRWQWVTAGCDNPIEVKIVDYVYPGSMKFWIVESRNDVFEVFHYLYDGNPGHFDVSSIISNAKIYLIFTWLRVS